MTTTALPPLPAHLLSSQLPPDYLRPFSFPLPKKRFVGVLACQRDPLAKELVSKVVRCDKRAEPIPATGKGSGKGGKGKKEKGGADTPVAQAEQLWEVELEDTVLFPEGGGQPSDTGVLIPSSTGQEVRVKQVMRHGLSAVHYTDAPLQVGEEVKAVVDWDRRWDLMTQHTGQHLLSAMFDQLSLETLSWALVPAPQPSYIELPRVPTPTELQHVQDACNALIRAGTRVHVSLSLASEENTVRPESMPEDYEGGVVRSINIVGVDENPCCGTHLPSLALLQALVVFPYTTSVRGTNARVYFVVGPRVVESLGIASERVREASLELGCSATEVVDKVKEVLAGAKDARKRETRAREELAGYIAKDFLAEKVEKVGDTMVGVLLRADEDAPVPLEFLSLLSHKIREALEGSSAAYLFVLAAWSQSAGTPVIIFGSSDALVAKAGDLVRAKMGAKVKGGGKGRWQGKRVEGKWSAEDIEMLRDIAREAAAA